MKRQPKPEVTSVEAPQFGDAEIDRAYAILNPYEQGAVDPVNGAGARRFLSRGQVEFLEYLAAVEKMADHLTGSPGPVS